jgi:hypothetical protein
MAPRARLDSFSCARWAATSLRGAWGMVEMLCQWALEALVKGDSVGLGRAGDGPNGVCGIIVKKTRLPTSAIK